MIQFQAFPIETSAKYLLTDSRTLAFPSESIFFAIKGPIHDGHKFIKELYNKGVKEFVIEELALKETLLNTISTFENCRFWLVPNSIEAMQNLVGSKREMFDLPVVGITGSNGKTIIKEWLGQLLTNNYSIVKSPKSYNSQLGVPLSVWQINKSHTLGIFEAGISQPGEMEKLEKVIQPTIGIFANIGTAHNEYFISNEEKILEKLKLFKNVDVLIYCCDNLVLDQIIKKYIMENNPFCKLLNWSTNCLSNINFNIDKSNISFSLLNYSDSEDGNYSLKFQFADEASVENICHCIVLMRYFNFDFQFIDSKLKMLKPVSMRLELKEGINDCYLIDDSYNNDLAGLRLALDFLSQQKQKERSIVIISDLLQSGEEESVLYTEIARLIKEKKITQIIGIGTVISRNASFFLPNSLFFPKTETFIESLDNINFSDSTVLIKGARKFAFEKIVNRLQLKTHETQLEINLDALTQNLNYFRNKISPSAKIMAMVKAFAYGSGNVEVASLLQFNGIDYLGVAYTDEGVYLRENGISLPIMVMNPNLVDFFKIIEYSLEPEMYSLKKIHEFSEFAESQNGIARIHIKLDTGMHRLGFLKGDLPEVIKILKMNPNIIVASIFSHLAASENPLFDDFTKNQISDFFEMAENISNEIGYSPLRHILNTAGIERFADYKMDMVRLGIGLYGVSSFKTERVHLQKVGTLKTKISQIKNINIGDTVGYGRVGKVEKLSKIGTIAIGYADGFDRRFGNGNGQVLIEGVLCPTIGNICMDMTMIDVSKTNAKEGDEVIIFGEKPTIYDLANNIGTIPYEILTNVGERVKRVFFKE